MLMLNGMLPSQLLLTRPNWAQESVSLFLNNSHPQPVLGPFPPP